MKICMPMEGESVSQHFGHTPRFLIVTLEDGKIVSPGNIQQPRRMSQGFYKRSCQNSMSLTLLPVAWEERHRDMFEEKNITVICGVTGNIYDAIQALIDGKLVSGESSRSLNWHDCMFS